MSVFSIHTLRTSLHQWVQRSQKKSFFIACFLGGVGAVSMASLVVIPGLGERQTEQAALAKNMAQVQETLTKLHTEKMQQPETVRLLTAPSGQEMVIPPTSVRIASDAHVAYWQKQMTAYGLMRGMNLVIRSREPSSYENSTKLTIEISSATSEPIAPMVRAQSLDFLQLYGFVESSTSTQAILHVALDKT